MIITFDMYTFLVFIQFTLINDILGHFDINDIISFL